MMDLGSTLKIAIRAIKVNKMRSILTSLGIIIGVSAVIIMLSIGAGANKRISDEIANMGSNLLIILSGSTTQGGIRMGSGTQPTLNVSDADYIKTHLSSVSKVAPILSENNQVVFENQNWSTQIVGSNTDYLSVRDMGIASGRAIYPEDLNNTTKVCLLGDTVAVNLFGDMNPVGKTIRIKGIPFTVIGLIAAKGQSMMGQDQDDIIIIPLTTAQKKLFGTYFPGMVKIIMVQANGEENMQKAEDDIKIVLRERHHLGLKKEDDFTIRNLTQMMQMAQESAKTMSILLGSIAAVSLLVGGIGIMNIMLVSVTERTKEIGIRMSIGAKREDILHQFIIEALIISLTGGFIGIILGIIGSGIISGLVGWDVYISPISIVLSFGFSGLVGIFFGFYPAYKASLLNPIDALRYE